MQQKKQLLVKILFEEVSSKARFEGRDGRAATERKEEKSRSACSREAKA